MPASRSPIVFIHSKIQLSFLLTVASSSWRVVRRSIAVHIALWATFGVTVAGEDGCLEGLPSHTTVVSRCAVPTAALTRTSGDHALMMMIV
jgi:hypothetical protein